MKLNYSLHGVGSGRVARVQKNSIAVTVNIGGQETTTIQSDGRAYSRSHTTTLFSISFIEGAGQTRAAVTVANNIHG